MELGGPDALGHLINRSQCWVVEGPEQPLALAIVRSEVLELLYVAPTERRQGIGRAIARTLIDAELVRDALALPGDRATKALYESIGWRARLLTMRGGD